jgi:hypothetical protein
VYDDPANATTIRCFYGTQDPCIKSVHAIREVGGEGVQFDFDSYSHHYILRVDAKPVGTLTSTHVSDGPLDCQRFYPGELLDQFGELVFSPCKLRIVRNRISSFRLMRLMLRQYWQHQLSLGGRMALLNASAQLIPFYLRLGLRGIVDSNFVHPVCKTDSLALLLSADVTHTSSFTDLSHVDPQLPMQVVHRCCPLTDQFVGRSKPRLRNNVVKRTTHQV